ncbi:sulfatase family protein [Pedobacter sp. MW01-1-1]|uniref:sulfatase family protein n=1 Tax=Pedobacter sp. MW01-1-1 TaxID=3383027 RepID=UPI003FF14F7C
MNLQITFYPLKKNAIQWLGMCLLLAFGPNLQAQQKQKKLPNIIYVLTDDLGIGDVKAFNPKSKIKTPGFDQLAKEGMIFTDAHSSSAVCSPSRYSILTGRYSWRTRLKNGVLNGESEALINPERLTAAKILKKAGYHTAYIGKWHMGWDWAKSDDKKIDFSKPVSNGPNQDGFDYAYGFSGSLDMPPYVYVENGKSTAIPTKETENTDDQGFWRKGLTAPDFVHEQATPNFYERAFTYIKEQAKSEKPFFLYLPLPSPHTPILPSKEWEGKSGLNNPYPDFVMMVDDYFAKLEKAVKDAGIADNTIIIFTSDNGCSPKAHMNELQKQGHYSSYIYRGAKADIFEGGHRIPLIIKWPGVIKPGTRCDQTTGLIDFMATAADIVKTALPENAAEDSYSMLPLFKDPKSTEYKRETSIHHSINGSFAIRKGKWKFILCAGSGGWSQPLPAKEKELNLPPFQLYDLESDPAEKNNLYGKYPAIEKELKDELTKEILQGRSTPGKPQQNDGGNNWAQLKWMQ